eukprot:COSAG01_NODE_547_length_15635_cov_102.896498_3_plen_221_part_00
MIRYFIKTHRYLGAVSALFIFLLAMTGLLLNHPGVFPKSETAGILAVYPSPLTEDQVWMLKKNGLFIADLEHGIVSAINLPFPPDHIKEIVHVKRLSHTALGMPDVYIAFKNNVILKLMNSKPLIWDLIEMPQDDYSGLVSLRYSKKYLYLKTDNALYKKLHTTSTWQVMQAFPYKFKDFIKALHTGYIFKPFLLIINDLTALIMMLLIGTGFYLILKKK